MANWETPVYSALGGGGFGQRRPSWDRPRGSSPPTREFANSIRCYSDPLSPASVWTIRLVCRAFSIFWVRTGIGTNDAPEFRRVIEAGHDEITVATATSAAPVRYAGPSAARQFAPAPRQVLPVRGLAAVVGPRSPRGAPRSARPCRGSASRRPQGGQVSRAARRQPNYPEVSTVARSAQR